ncbi:tRNA-splicing endonuclease [Meyerozyma sp. JA9]|nr:tRNA-splicing endonuclease [Meyerozyma sp. JA9]
MIPLPVVAKDVVVFDVAHIRQLRSLGIVGVLSGTLAAAPQQNLLLGVPLRLSIFDAVWLVRNSHAFLYDSAAYHQGLSTTSNPVDTSIDSANHSNFITIASTSSAPGPPPSEYQISIDEFMPKDTKTAQLYKVYSSLRSRGYWVSPGLRFGGDFVAYPGDPLLFHSHLIVSHADTIANQELVHRGRLATGVKKLWCVVDSGEKAYSIEWAGFG